MMRTTLLSLLGIPLCAALVSGQQPTPEQKQQIDAAVPGKAPAKPKKPRRMLVSNLCVRDGKVMRGHPSIASGNYALDQMGKRSGAYEAVFSNDVEIEATEALKKVNLWGGQGVFLHRFPSYEPWCRDHGPIFVP